MLYRVADEVVVVIEFLGNQELAKDFSYTVNLHLTTQIMRRIKSEETKSIPITKRMVWNAYQKVKSGVQDYHWYRQDKGGLWSQKHGSAHVTNIDGSSPGRLIRNPTRANHYYGTYSKGTLNYSSGGMFLWVRKR